MPELREAVESYHRGDRKPARELDEWYAGGRESVRTAVMDLNGCCFEVPCLVDANGVQPTHAGELPAPCAGINLASVGYQHTVVAAYRQRSRDLIYAAVALDRLTSALLDLDQIRRMCDEMIEAQSRWLPEVR